MKRPLYKDHPSWKDFFPSPKEVRFFETKVEESWIPSGRHEIHLDIYRQSREAPTVLYLHGMASCARIMGHFGKGLYEAGFNVICPDLIGFGMTTVRPGTGTIEDFLDNIDDVVRFARGEFKGALFLAGISMGGALSYYAAARGADIQAIASHCLFDFSDPETLEIGDRPWLARLTKPLLQKVGNRLPEFFLPLTALFRIDRFCDDPQILELFKKSPLAVKRYSLRAVTSLLTTAPEVPFHEFSERPVLVLHGTEDRLIPEEMSQKNFRKLGSKKKYVGLKRCSHVPVRAESFREATAAMADWFGRYC